MDLSIVLSSLFSTFLRVSSDYLFKYNAGDLLVVFSYKLLYNPYYFRVLVIKNGSSL